MAQESGFCFLPLPPDRMGEFLLCVICKGGMGCELSFFFFIVFTFGDTGNYVYQDRIPESTVYFFHLVNN